MVENSTYLYKSIKNNTFIIVYNLNLTNTTAILDSRCDVLYSQVVDLTMMSKIELGDDVISEIKRLRGIINQNEDLY